MPHGAPAWLIARYRDARVVLTDRRFVTRVPGMDADAPRMAAAPPKIEVNIARYNGPEHLRLRKVMAKAFTVRRTEAQRPRTARTVARLVDALRAEGPPADLVRHFALPLPLYVISDLLGVRREHVDTVMTWSNAFLSSGVAKLTPQQVNEYATAFTDYMTEQIRTRRGEPGTVIGELAEAAANGVVSEHEAALLAISLLLSGREGTTVELTNFVYLLDHFGQWRRLAEDPGLVRSAVEELLRFTPLSAGTAVSRCAVADVEINGQLVRAGDLLIVPFAAANWDASVFDRPGELDLTRERNPHLAFGFGPHRCVAAELARMTLQEALSQLTRALPNLRVVVPPDGLAWLTTRQFRGFAELPVGW
ncbi:cytochrome P450 [Goodfellowiella coeruleoviolacea]|uniref:Cytochrome P450 n=1 Tax=Goodfellowiella coeruleoviolacea TaxID=334858 RepID=A0AAE3GIC4_9PSEU|nr:cytochrome P450 [Goodfellowiella coeruleoviolacea]MCP2168737.1 Cytochrome P450 [Goodfellowiella coeruleoviolacea]